MVSSKKGPHSGSGLSNSASVFSSPWCRYPSKATSNPSIYASTSRCVRSNSSIDPAMMLRIRSHAAINSARSSARITPRLAERFSGLTTQGQVSPAICSSIPGKNIPRARLSKDLKRRCWRSCYYTPNIMLCSETGRCTSIATTFRNREH